MLRIVTVLSLPLTALIASCDVSNDACFALCAESSLGSSSFSNFCTTESSAETCDEDAQAFCDNAGIPLADVEFVTDCGCGEDEECKPDLDAP